MIFLELERWYKVKALTLHAAHPGLIPSAASGPLGPHAPLGDPKSPINKFNAFNKLNHISLSGFSFVSQYLYNLEMQCLLYFPILIVGPCLVNQN